MESKISIVNKKLLQNQLDTLDIKYVIDDNPFCWVFDLLRQASQSIDSLQDFGIVLKDGAENNLFELKKVIESELFSLSEAHFQRYFKIEKHYRA